MLGLAWSTWWMTYEWQYTFGTGQGTNNAIIPAAINDGQAQADANAATWPQANQNGYEGWEMLCNFTQVGVTELHCANGLSYSEELPNQ